MQYVPIFHVEGLMFIIHMEEKYSKMKHKQKWLPQKLGRKFQLTMSSEWMSIHSCDDLFYNPTSLSHCFRVRSFGLQNTSSVLKVLPLILQKPMLSLKCHYYSHYGTSLIYGYGKPVETGNLWPMHPEHWVTQSDTTHKRKLWLSHGPARNF